MPKPRPQVDVDQVARLRLHFFEHFTDDGINEAYDARDLQTFRSSDEYVHKFLMIAKFDFGVTAEKVNTVFKWRKQFGVNDLTYESFSGELLNIGGFYGHNQCKIGRQIVWFKVCKHKKDPLQADMAKRFIAFWLNKYESERMGDTVVILMDLTNAGLINMDMDVIKFLISCFELYFPALVGIMLVYDMHWILNAIWKIIEKLLSAESRDHIKFIRGSAILDFIDEDQLPAYMGGSDTWEWSWPLPEMEQDVLEKITEEENKADDQEEEDEEEEQLDRVFSIPNGDVSQHLAKETNQSPIISPTTSATSSPTSPATSPASSPATSPASSPSTSPTIPERRVHFSTPTGGAEGGELPTTPDTRMPPRRTSKTKTKSDIHKGPFLTIQPGNEIGFEELSPPSEKKPSLVLNLTNTTRKRVAYKIKTTTPDRYKVRPSVGPINPGASIKITITLLSGDKDSVPQDKFLIQSSELHEVLRTPSELTAFWQQVERDDIVEHRIRCTYFVSRDSELGILQLKKDMTKLLKKVDRVTHEVYTVKEIVTTLLRLILVQMFLIGNIMLYYGLFVYGDEATRQALDKAFQPTAQPASTEGIPAVTDVIGDYDNGHDDIHSAL